MSYETKLARLIVLNLPNIDLSQVAPADRQTIERLVWNIQHEQAQTHLLYMQPPVNAEAMTLVGGISV